MSLRTCLMCSFGLIALVGCGDDGGSGDPDAAPTDAASDGGTLDAADAMMVDIVPTGCMDEEVTFSVAARMNTHGTDPLLTSPTSPATPSFSPLAGSPALAGGVAPPNDGFFDTAATYRGALGTTDWTAPWASYPINQTPADTGTVVTLVPTSGNELMITANTTWTTGTTYKMPAAFRVYVTNNAVLTIQPGVIVKGAPGSTIIITKGSRIDAQGTAAMPIIMTSDQPTGTAAKGNWAGLILLGDAPTNNTMENGTVEGLEAADVRHRYGGAVPTHNCGTLRYVRLEYTGAIISGGNEIQGLTMAGCGSATTVDFLQSHRSDDDGIEIFGGSVNMKHVIVSITDDDGLDWDRGWTGKVQHLIVMQAKDRAVEADNKNGAETAAPVSRPTIYNATFAGLGAVAGVNSTKGLHLRRGTAGIIRNSIITEFSQSATGHSVDVDGVGSYAEAVNGRLLIERTMFFHNGTGTYDDWPTGFDVPSGMTVQNDCVP